MVGVCLVDCPVYALGLSYVVRATGWRLIVCNPESVL